MSNLNVASQRASQRASQPLTGTLSRRSFLTIAGVSLASTALALTGCGNQSAGAATSGSTGGSLKKVRIGVPGQDNTLVENGSIAQKHGFLKEELEKVGYEPEFSGFAQAGPAINEAFSSGSLDLTEYGDLPGYSAIAKGVGLKAFASGNSAQQYGIFVTNASGVKELGDLKGKKIVVGFGTVQHRYLLGALKLAGLTAQDVELINSAMDGPTMVASGQADAVATALAYIYYAIDQSTGHVLAPTSDKKYESLAPTFLYFYRTDFHKENPKVAPAITKALIRAYELAKKDRAQALKDIATKSLPEELANKIYLDKSFKTFDPQITDDVKKRVADLGAFMKENKLAAREVSADEFFDTKVYEEASKA